MVAFYPQLLTFAAASTTLPYLPHSVNTLPSDVRSEENGNAASDNCHDNVQRASHTSRVSSTNFGTSVAKTTMHLRDPIVQSKGPAIIDQVGSHNFWLQSVERHALFSHFGARWSLSWSSEMEDDDESAKRTCPKLCLLILLAMELLLKSQCMRLLQPHRSISAYCIHSLVS